MSSKTGLKVFEVTSRDSNSRARTGSLHTAHGVVETPVFMPVATQGSVKGDSTCVGFRRRASVRASLRTMRRKYAHGYFACAKACG